MGRCDVSGQLLSSQSAASVALNQLPASVFPTSADTTQTATALISAFIVSSALFSLLSSYPR